jgi:hypothetical protein
VLELLYKTPMSFGGHETSLHKRCLLMNTEVSRERSMMEAQRGQDRSRRQAADPTAAN